MTNNAISVSQIASYIKAIFDAEEMLHGIMVYGELVDLSVRGDMAFFTLKDNGAALNCVAFDSANKFAKVKNGDQVVVTGSPSYYVKGGRLNFNVSKIEPYGQGAFYLQFLRLKEQLEKEGLFDQNRKKTMPKNIATIGVVTAEAGAVIRDIIHVTRRRNPNVNIVLYPAKVQGEGAAQTVIEGVRFFEQYAPVDAIVVARGGGSAEDLSAFNDEALARAVFDCSKFVVSAVGHETDFTILDFVASLRAPTPSAAAELLTEDIASTKEVWTLLQTRLTKGFLRLVENKQNRFSLVKQQFVHAFASMLANAENTLTQQKNKLVHAMDGFVTQKEYQISYADAALGKLNPKNILQRGYAKLEQENKSIATLNMLNQQKPFLIIMQDGQMVAKKQGEENGI